MKIQELRDKTSALRKEKLYFLNDTFLWVQLAREAVRQLPDTGFKFEVPKAGTEKKRTVTRSHVKNLKPKIIGLHIYTSAFVSMVAAVEDYLSKIMRWILLCDNKRIKCTVSDVNFSKEIPIIDLVDKSRDTLIEEIVSQRAERLFYAGPQKQLEYFDKALSIKIDDVLWGKWIEIKARRDLWIHNGGIVNQIYIKKTRAFRLCDLGSTAVINKKYFADCVSSLKKLIVRIDQELQKVYTV